MFVVFSKTGQAYVLRPLCEADGAALAEYFAEFGEQSRRGFAPHPLTPEHAYYLCRQVKNSTHERWVLVDNQQTIGAYIVLAPGPEPAEAERYASAGVAINQGLHLRFAPSVADRLQGQGLASALMAPMFQVARSQGAESLVLMGGVREDNAAALAFYQKVGFQIAGRFFWDEVENVDLFLPLARWAETAMLEDPVYCINAEVSVDQFRHLLQSSGLGERRPLNDTRCLDGMLNNSNLVVSVWQNDTLVGIARSLSDFHYACYLSDLAVSCHLQRQGIGKALIKATRVFLGEHCKLILIAAPAASDYYHALGFVKNDRCWVLDP